MTSAPRSQDTPANSHLSLTPNGARPRQPAQIHETVAQKLLKPLGSKVFCQQICKIHAEFEHTNRARASFPAKSKTAAIYKSP